MEWRSVQEERPRAETSGGQSRGGLVDFEVVLDMANQEDTSVQVRHL